jgi:hypothetical protein
LKTFLKLFPYLAMLCFGLSVNVYAIPSCCAGKAAGGPRVGSLNNGVMKAADFLYNAHLDSLDYLLGIYGYYGNSWSPDGHRGDPLGTGGKWPLSYTMELYREQSVETNTLLKRDLREQYSDFGYIPLWRMNTLGISGKYRLSPELLSTVQMVYGGDPGKPGTNENGSLGMGEASLQWSPFAMPSFWIKAGNILDAGTYSSLFDQNPVENFLYTGVMASWAANRGDNIKTITSFAFGGAFINSTYLQDPAYDYYANQGYLRAGRQRSYAYVKTSALIDNSIGLKALGGVQYIPADSSQDVLGRMYRYDEGKGVMAGIEATWFGESISHTAMVTFARGDAVLGFGAPDYVINPRSSGIVNPDHSTPVQQYSFTRDASSCINIFYWSGYENGPFHLSAGIWYNGRIPAQNAVTFLDPTPENVRSSLPASRLRDSTVTINTEPFHALRLSLFPSLRIGETPFFVGIRYDNITYLTPDAHTNMIEYERDQTLRPVSYPGIDAESAAKVYGPAKWDREAIDANILSPTLRLDFKEIGGITAAYAMGFYKKPIDRQGRISNFHGNFTLGADMFISIKKIGRQKKCEIDSSN